MLAMCVVLALCRLPTRAWVHSRWVWLDHLDLKCQETVKISAMRFNQGPSAVPKWWWTRPVRRCPYQVHLVSLHLRISLRLSRLLCRCSSATTALHRSTSHRGLTHWPSYRKERTGNTLISSVTMPLGCWFISWIHQVCSFQLRCGIGNWIREKCRYVLPISNVMWPKCWLLRSMFWIFWTL